MKLPTPCFVCSKERNDGLLVFSQGELDDEGVVHVTCSCGHRTAVLFDARRHEVLLRSGAKALLVGFEGEAVATLSAALERAYEFYVRVVLRYHGIPVDQVDRAWGELGSQSERQLGAFAILYLREMKEPLLLDSAIPKMRNRIVHQGHVPRAADARRFGELVFSRVRRIEKALANYHDAAEAERAHEMLRQENSLPAGIEHGTMKIMSLMTKDGEVVEPIESFEDYLTALQQSIKKGLA